MEDALPLVLDVVRPRRYRCRPEFLGDSLVETEDGDQYLCRPVRRHPFPEAQVIQMGAADSRPDGEFTPTQSHRFLRCKDGAGETGVKMALRTGVRSAFGDGVALGHRRELGRDGHVSISVSGSALRALAIVLIFVEELPLAADLSLIHDALVLGGTRRDAGCRLQCRSTV